MKNWLFEYICLLNTYLYGNTREKSLPSLNNPATTLLLPLSAMPCMLYIQVDCLFVEFFLMFFRRECRTVLTSVTGLVDCDIYVPLMGEPRLRLGRW